MCLQKLDFSTFKSCDKMQCKMITVRWSLLCAIYLMCYTNHQVIQTKQINISNTTVESNTLYRSSFNVTKHQRVRRAIPVDTNRIFLNRQVSYFIDDAFPSEEVQLINQAINEIEMVSCIKFIALSNRPDKSSDIDFIDIVPLDGCYSDVGRVGGRQVLSLAVTCFTSENGKAPAAVLHELMHSLGFWHEHSRHDRDEYIEVIFENIIPTMRSSFSIMNKNLMNTVFPYDIQSIMHYTATDYSVDPNEFLTIRPKDPNISPGQVGRKNGLTDLDKKKLNFLYMCNISSCSDPGRPINGDRIGSNYEVGQSVRFICTISGHTLIGSKTRYCRSDGHWAGYMPECVKNVHHHCDFESGRCDWSNVDGNDWSLSDPSDYSRLRPETGPKLDNTIGTTNGHYLFVDSELQVKGDLVTVTSPWIVIFPDFEDAVCISFYYYMWGTVMGSLKAEVEVEKSTNFLLFEKEGNLGPKWIAAKYSIPMPGGTMKIQIKLSSIVGDNSYSDVAVDDVLVKGCTKQNSGSENFLTPTKSS